MSLCHRCEHRIAHMEATAKGDRSVPQPRCECGDYGFKDGKFFAHSSYSCYMYKPVLPVLTSKNEDDPGPRLGAPMIAARERAVRVLTRDDVDLTIIYTDGESVALGWTKKEDENEEGKETSCVCGNSESSGGCSGCYR